MNNDKQIELKRYDSRAQDLLTDAESAVGTTLMSGALACPPIFRAPYSYYEQCIHRYITHNHDVLEIGSGIGLHTKELTRTGARVVASDISSHSLKVLGQRIEGVKTCVADMELLPFESNSFHAVVSAGSLSYGNPAFVDAEILRVLRPGGMFLCVDSLNHNPVYRLNRWLHYMKGERTISTLRYMPKIERIRSLSKGFQRVEVKYFGAVSYLMPFVAHILGQSLATRFSDAIDRLVHVRRAAFKFVMVAHGRF